LRRLSFLWMPHEGSSWNSARPVSSNRSAKLNWHLSPPSIRYARSVGPSTMASYALNLRRTRSALARNGMESNILIEWWFHFFAKDRSNSSSFFICASSLWWRMWFFCKPLYPSFRDWRVPCCFPGLPIHPDVHGAQFGESFQGEIIVRRSQGRYFSQEEINRITSLLRSTDMTLQEIATRMGCAKSSIVSINRMFQIREYRGRRSYWVLADTVVPENNFQMESESLTVSPSWVTPRK